jgi:hypothetical protein
MWHNYILEYQSALKKRTSYWYLQQSPENDVEW